MATTPADIPRDGWLDIAARVKTRIGEDRLTLTAAGVAFFGLLALFPAITATLAIAGLVLDRARVVEQLDSLSGVVPDDVLSIIRTQAESVTTSQGLELALLISVALALWSASRGVANLCTGLNIAYREDEKRGFLAKNAQVLGLTVLVISGLVVGLVAIIGIPIALAALPLVPAADLAARAGRWVVLSVMTIAGLAVLYRYGPSRADARWAWVSHGATVACALWIIASYAFTVYVSNFARYNESFGTLGGVIILLLWLWITVMVVLIGATINAETEHQTRMDSTTGDPRPMGQRGAVVADTLGEIRSKEG